MIYISFKQILDNRYKLFFKRDSEEALHFWILDDHGIISTIEQISDQRYMSRSHRFITTNETSEKVDQFYFFPKEEIEFSPELKTWILKFLWSKKFKGICYQDFTVPKSTTEAPNLLEGL